MNSWKLRRDTRMKAIAMVHAIAFESAEADLD
jgi:hypothetical protein